MKYWVVVQQGRSYPMGEGASLVFFHHLSSDGITIKIPDGLDVLLHHRASHPIFFYWVVKTEFDFVRSVETGLGR